MKFANINGRPALVTPDAIIDVADATSGLFGSVKEIVQKLDEFRDWLKNVDLSLLPVLTPELTDYGPPIPNPGQIWAAGLNYPTREGSDADTVTPPEVFMISPSALSAPYADIHVQGDKVDFEVEIVAVVGKDCYKVPKGSGEDFIAGYMVAQDVSDRDLQFAAPPQLCVAKSMRSYAPTGPYFVTSDDLGSFDSLEIRSYLNGDLQQRDLLASMVRGPGSLVEFFSSVSPLRAGDLIFCGTPAGVGFQQSPPRFLRDGDIVRSEIDGIGHLENSCTTAVPDSESF